MTIIFVQQNAHAATTYAHFCFTGSSLLCGHDDWIKGKRGQPYTLQKLYPLKALPTNQTYTVTVATSDQRGAGTDGDVSVVLVGSEGCTGAFKYFIQVLHFRNDHHRK